MPQQWTFGAVGDLFFDCADPASILQPALGAPQAVKTGS